MADVPELPDSLFSLPESIWLRRLNPNDPNSSPDPQFAELLVWYETIIQRLRHESVGIPMSTIQELLLERIAYNYCVLRSKEMDHGTSAGFEHSKYQKDFNTFWLAMTQEWNRLVRGDKDADVKSVLMNKLSAALRAASNASSLEEYKEILAAELESLEL